MPWWGGGQVVGPSPRIEPSSRRGALCPPRRPLTRGVARHNLLRHVGLVSSLRHTAFSKLPGCYGDLVTPHLFEVRLASAACVCGGVCGVCGAACTCSRASVRVSPAPPPPPLGPVHLPTSAPRCAAQVEAFDLSMCGLDDVSPCPPNAETKVDWIALSKS